MTRKQVWRYYCDHCHKGGCAAGHMAKHERGCTLNPERVCGVCAKLGLAQTPVAELVAIAKAAPICELQDDPRMVALLRELEEAAGPCPVCVLAALRQADRHHDVNFQIKPLLTSLWADHNSRYEYAR